MGDPYLMAMMRGDFSRKKGKAMASMQSKIDEAVEKSIEEYLDTIDFEAEVGQDKLQTPQMKREQLRQEMQKSLQMPELQQGITASFQILVAEGEEALESNEYEVMMAELMQIGDKIQVLPLVSIVEQNLQSLLNISAATMKAIFKVATVQFVQGRLENCSALFTMLTALNPGHPEYWLRGGMAAHQSNNMDLALRSYQAAAEIDPQMAEVPLLMADCHLRLGDKDQAKVAFQQAKAIAASQELDPEWKELLQALAASLS